VHWRYNATQAVIETRNDLVAMAKNINDVVLPGETLATHDIGAVGYFGDFKVLDLVGLVNPDAVQYHAQRQTRAQMEKERPDFLLIFPEWDRNYLMINPWYYPNKYLWIGTYPGGELRKAPYFLYRIVYPQYTVGPAPGDPAYQQATQAALLPQAPISTPLFPPSKISPPSTGDAGLLDWPLERA
jgi:hypothetical protein